jgi:hypothetical protein
VTDKNTADRRALDELLELSTGLGILLLPLSALAVPGLLLFVVLPAALLAIPFVILAAIVLPPVVLARRLLRKSPV